jgi:hypothetical protein
MASFVNPDAGTSGQQVTIYKSDGSTTTAQKYRREGEDKSELDMMLESGDWSRTPFRDSKSSTERSMDAGIETAKALMQHMPEALQREFAKSWVKFGDVTIAKQAVRQTPAWEKEFGFLKRDDGSLIMDELSALATKATYRESLAEVGIADTTPFEEQFESLIKGEVSGAEFQQRIDTVWNSVKNNIPQVESMFREQYNIDSDTPTIFAALINPEVQDKLLKGELQSLKIGAEARAAGFNRSFTRFESLRKAGMTQEKARDLYQSATPLLERASSLGQGLDIGTLEAAAIGDTKAQQTVARKQSEIQSESSMVLGAAKKGKQVTGLLEG